MKKIISILLWALLFTLLRLAGLNELTWQFWAIWICCMAISITYAVS